MTLSLTATNSGYYVVMVRMPGESVFTDQEPTHTTEREAIEHSTNLEQANPEWELRYQHRYEVLVEQSTPTPPPPPVNQAPDANAGGDLVFDEGQTVTLVGSGADPDGTIELFTWVQLSGPGVTLSNPNAVNPTFTAPEVTEDTVLSFRLTVVDNIGASDSDEVSITIRNVVIAPPSPPEVARYPLEITNIMGVGANNRIGRGYPGLLYNFRPAVIGGVYPYRYVLASAPTGMVIDEQSGRITWPNPGLGQHGVALSVFDEEGSEVVASWSIEVQTAGFLFLTPEQNLLYMYGPSADNDIYAGQTMIMHGGVYDANNIPHGGLGGSGAWERVEFVSGYKPVVWMPYPGEEVIIDGGYIQGERNGALFRFRGPDVFLDGLNFQNFRIMAIQQGWDTDYATFGNLKFERMGPSFDGSNGACIMSMESSDAPSDRTYIHSIGCFDPLQPSELGIKAYSLHKALIEDVHVDGMNGIELKHDISRFTVRGGRINATGLGIGGNMHGNTTHGEIYHNLVNAPTALRLNQDHMAQAIHVYQNETIGDVLIEGINENTGPVYLKNNRFDRPWSPVECTAPSRIIDQGGNVIGG